MKLLHNAKLFDGHAFLLADALAIDAGHIVRVGCRDDILTEDAEIIDMEGQIVAPGFVDTHIHGCMGHGCMQPGGTLAMAEQLPRFGVTSFCPSAVSSGVEETQAFLRDVKDAMPREQGSRIVGAHLEGPFLAPDARGIHREAALCLPSEEAYRSLTDGCEDVVVRVTIAPELPGAMDLIERLATERIVVSLGHTSADALTCRAAIERGASLATHMFNAMPPLHHRDANATVEMLTNDAIRCEFVCDGIHVHPLMAKLLLRSKGDGLGFVCTDAMPGAGMPDGRYMMDGTGIDVRDGQAKIGDRLAGSTATMDAALRNLVTLLKVPLERALAMLSYIPAQVLGLEDEIGRIARGYQADLVVLDDALDVQACYVRGALAWTK